MSTRALDRRLADLEAQDQARQERVYGRVMRQLTDAELECFCAVVEREPQPGSAVSDEEVRVLCRVERLTQADAEARPGDLLNVPREWMEEAAHAQS
jgi:hypothetical protein